MSDAPQGEILRLAWYFPRLARRSHHLAARVAGGPSLELTVRHQGRRYLAQINYAGAGRTWRCPHRHLTPASASQCGGAMARRVNRLGWQRAIARQRPTRRAPGRPG